MQKKYSLQTVVEELLVSLNLYMFMFKCDDENICGNVERDGAHEKRKK